MERKGREGEGKKGREKEGRVREWRVKTVLPHVKQAVAAYDWLKINERIKYKLLSLTYKVLTTNQPQYIND